MMTLDQKTFRLTGDGNLMKKTLIIGVVAFLAGIAGYFMDSDQFFHSYLVAYLFWITAGLGAMFFVLVFHLTGSVWSIVLRRIAETMMMVVPIMAIFFIPILFGMHDLYHWTHPAAADKVLQHKVGYLNIPFFMIRSLIYFAAWYLIARSLYKSSLDLEHADPVERIKRMRKVSAIGVIVFALTVTFAAIDWIMSLEPHWYSTIFGAYIFSGSLIGALSFFILIGLYLRKKNILQDVITTEHYHDLAIMIFGFIIFWGYMGFSQYFLMWYANIPEETIYYLKRWEGTWKIFSLTLVLGHFALPFVLLLPRAMKRNLTFLKILAVWLLIMHWIDVYWMVMVNHSPQGIHLHWIDAALFIGLGGIVFGVFWKFFSAHPLVPVGDPGLPLSIEYENR